jgi:hypothetical protein
VRTSEILYKAALVVRERGWRTFGSDPDDVNAPVCMLGAIAAVEGRSDWPDASTPPALLTVVGREDLLPLNRVFSFNDDDCECADDAIAALEIAADIAHASGK